MLFAGRKARPGSRRIPQTQTSGAAGLKGRCTSTRVHSVRTHSAFNRGFIPTAALESLPVLRFRLLVLSFASPIGRQSKAPASPPVQHFLHPNPIPSANGGGLSQLRLAAVGEFCS